MLPAFSETWSVTAGTVRASLESTTAPLFSATRPAARPRPRAVVMMPRFHHLLFGDAGLRHLIDRRRRRAFHVRQPDAIHGRRGDEIKKWMLRGQDSGTHRR